MTKHHAAPQKTGLLAKLMDVTGYAGRMLAKLTLGALIVFAAGVIAFATAIMGLLFAAAALVLRLSGAKPQPQPVPVRANDGRALNARRTARGWTVE